MAVQSRKVERTQDAPLVTVPLTAEERRSRSLWLPNEENTGRISLDDFDRSDPVVYEPRALWNVFSIDSSASTVPASRAEVELKNKSRHTVVLTHMTLCPIGYSLREQIGLSVSGLVRFHNAMDVLSRIDFFVSAPFRQHLSKSDILSHALSPEPNGTPSYRQAATASRHRSSTFGLSRWQFDKPYWLPRRGSMQFDLSTVAQPDHRSTQLTAPHAAVVMDEQWGEGGRFRQHARFADRAQLNLADVSSAAVWPDGPTPTVSDAFGNLQPASPTRNVWNSYNFTADEFKRQQSSRGADRSWFRGFSVMIDQIDWDDGIDGSGDADAENQPISPLSTRIITRARSRNGGSGEWWWSPGAPLALVVPTFGPGLTFELPQPIVLAGLADAIEVELQAPTPTTVVVAGEQGETELSPTYNIGASFTGYAMIEG